MAIFVVKAIASLGVVSALAVGGSAVTQKAIACAVTQKASTPTHAIKGVVKSISAFYLAIVTGSGKKAREVLTLILARNPAGWRNHDRRNRVGPLQDGRPHTRGDSGVRAVLRNSAQHSFRDDESGPSYLASGRRDSAGPPMTAPFGVNGSRGTDSPMSARRRSSRPGTPCACRLPTPSSPIRRCHETPRPSAVGIQNLALPAFDRSQRARVAPANRSRIM